MGKPAVVLLSGGVDSTTTLAIAKSEHFDINALSFEYGQRHTIELQAARQCSAFFHVRKHLIIDFDLRGIGGSALTSDMDVPKTGIGALESRIGEVRNNVPDTRPGLQIPVTYVPARNTIFLSFALSWAEVLGAEDIFIGANAVDYSGYPDCRPEFITAFEHMANLATKASVEGRSHFKIHTPLLNLAKKDIIIKGSELGVDYSKTWSCYDPQPAKEEVRSQWSGGSGTDQSLFFYVPCMRCDSCLLRAKGFREAGIGDPLSALNGT